MKPSNTGIDWAKEARERAPVDRTAEGVYDIGAVVGYSRIESVCEWAAQIAIAEYRKELAAKVGAIDDGDELVWREDVLSLLNENDDAE